MTVSEDRADRPGRVREYDTGTLLYHEGDEGETLYIVQSGLIALRRQRGKHEELEQIERGDFFGELSVINGSPRDATAVVVERSRLLEIDVSTFERMLKANAEIAVRIIRKMATRIDRLSRRPLSSEVRMVLAAVAQAPSAGESGTAPAGGEAPEGGAEALALASVEPAAFGPAMEDAAPPAPPAGSWPTTPGPAPAASPAASWPLVPGAAPGAAYPPDQALAPSLWNHGGQLLTEEPYADLGYDQQSHRGASPATIFLLIVLTLAGVVGLIATIVMMQATNIDR